MTADDILMKLAANIPTDDSSTAGGSMSATEITNSAPGEWMPKLVAKESGTIDDVDDIEQQTQLAYIENAHASDTADQVGFYMDNLLIHNAVAGLLKLTGLSASDDATKKARVWGICAGVLDTEDITLNGTTEVTGLKSWTRIERGVILDTGDDSIVDPAGRIDMVVGTEAIGHFAAANPYVSSEFEFACPTTSGDLATFTNRRTTVTVPAWTRPNTPDTRVYVRNDVDNSALTHGQKCGVYCRQTLQPGIPAAVILRELRPYGEAA